MESMGFEVHSEVTNKQNLANDFIFVQKQIMDSLRQRGAIPTQS